MRWFGKRTVGLGGFEFFKYLGPGFLVTVGFIDPGNWAANMAAGSNYGYSLLWMVSLSTLMLILLQHNAAHLGIVTGLCLSEACAKYFGRGVSGLILGSAVGASVSTALAEVLGTAIGLNMLFGLPLPAGALLSSGLVLYMLFSNSYPRLEKWILGFVSLIGIAFLLELSMVKIPWSEAARAWVVPSLPSGSLPVVMSVLGAVVMPHNLFLHSEVIQSRQWNLQGEEVIQKQLKFEYADTLVAMLVGWVINSTMILVAASVFHTHGVVVTELPQAQATLKPLLGNAAAVIFALALLFSGFSSSLTAGMAGGSIFAGIFQKPFNSSDRHSRMGIYVTLFGALGIILFIQDPFQGLLWSQIILSIQLPLTIVPLILLTSSPRVMGKYANSRGNQILLWAVAFVVLFLNVMLLIQIL
ncbi:MAG: Nramp family divalent metal transporter [Deltaproteobacteria bacterium]|nr:Nramp family divalent metal transporter [Deltaproteobacteria bacterium]